LNPPKEEKATLKSIKKTLYSKKVTILMLVFFFLFSLRVINWFEPPNILISGDVRPPLVQEAFLKRVAYTWDETDFGMPSVYAPRILVPSNLFISTFQNLGMNLYNAQMMSLVLMFFFSSVLMYILVKRLTNGNIVASFFAALFLTSNLYLINDREVTAIAFLDVALVILPCLMAFIEGIKRKSYTFVALSGILFVLTYSAFPNFRVALMCIFALTIALLFIFFNKGLKFSFRREKSSTLAGVTMNVGSLKAGLEYSFIFVVAGILASIWIIIMIWTNYGVFAQAYSQLGVPPYYLDISLHDAVRLITKWGFYSGSLGQPYIPYASTYLHNPLIVILSYLPPIMAFASLFVSKSRKLTIYFSATAALFLFLSAGFNPYFSRLYLTLASNLPLMLAFRESAQWTFFVVISYSILIGLTISAIYNKFKHQMLRVLIISLTIAVLLASAYPIATGDISRNYLNTDIKGSYFPDSYRELNNALSNEYWGLLLPQRSVYVTYNFSGITLGSGNPNPLIFSKPILTNLGSEYMQSDNLLLLNAVYDSILVNEEANVAPKGNASASSIEKVGRFLPGQAIDGNISARWSSDLGIPQQFEVEWNQTQQLKRVKIFFENAYANNYTIESWNGSDWTTQFKVEENMNLEPEYVFLQPTPSTKLRINFTEAQPFGRVSLWELELYAYQGNTVSKFLGTLGIKHLILENDIALGNMSNVKDLKAQLDQNQNFVLSDQWKEVAMYNNTNALQKLYPADNFLNFTSLENMLQTVKETEWETLQHSVFLNSTSTKTPQISALETPENFEWNELSPTSYVAHVKSKSAFILAFLESYDKNWKVTVNGNPVLRTNQYEVNDFANAWLIEDTGDLTITLQYEIQNVFLGSVVVSIILSALLMAYFSRKDITKAAVLIHRKIKQDKTDPEQQHA